MTIITLCKNTDCHQYHKCYRNPDFHPGENALPPIEPYHEGVCVLFIDPANPWSRREPMESSTTIR